MCPNIASHNLHDDYQVLRRSLSKDRGILPSRGKTHFFCAIGHELIQKGNFVIFIHSFRLAQGLLTAKRDLLLKKIASFGQV